MRIHEKSKVQELGLYQAISFNVPRLSSVNMIELYFSAVRNLYLGRPPTHSREEEAASVLRCLKKCNTEPQLGGYRRQLLRTLVSLLSENFKQV